MRKLVITAILWLACQLHAQTAIDLSKQSRNVNFSTAPATIPWSAGTALPGTCRSGQAYYRTDLAAGQNVYICAAGNQWAPVTSGSSRFTTGSGDPVSNCTAGQDIYADTANQNIWFCSATNVWLVVLSTSDSGSFLLTGLNGGAPSTPGQGTTSMFFNSGAKLAQTVDDAGLVATMVRPADCSSSSEVVEKINADGTVTCVAGGSGGSGGPVTVTRYFPAAMGTQGAPIGIWPAEAGAVGSGCSTTYPECWMHWYEDGSYYNWAGFSDVVPANWVSGAVRFSIRFTGNGSTNQWGVAYACQGNNAADPPALSAINNLSATATIAGNYYVTSVTLPMTGCSAGNTITYKVTRVDTNGYINLLGADLSYVTP